MRRSRGSARSPPLVPPRRRRATCASRRTRARGGAPPLAVHRAIGTPACSRAALGVIHQRTRAHPAREPETRAAAKQMASNLRREARRSDDGDRRALQRHLPSPYPHARRPRRRAQSIGAAPTSAMGLAASGLAAPAAAAAAAAAGSARAGAAAGGEPREVLRRCRRRAVAARGHPARVARVGERARCGRSLTPPGTWVPRLRRARRRQERKPRRRGRGASARLDRETSSARASSIERGAEHVRPAGSDAAAARGARGRCSACERRTRSLAQGGDRAPANAREAHHGRDRVARRVLAIFDHDAGLTDVN